MQSPLPGQDDARTTGPICGIPRGDMPREFRRFFMAGDIIFFQQRSQKRQTPAGERQNQQTTSQIPDPSKTVPFISEILGAFLLCEVGMGIIFSFSWLWRFLRYYRGANSHGDDDFEILLWMPLYGGLGILGLRILSVLCKFFYLVRPDLFMRFDSVRPQAHEVRQYFEDGLLEDWMLQLVAFPGVVRSFVGFYGLVRRSENSWWYRDRRGRDSMGPMVRRAGLLNKGSLVVCLTPYPDVFSSWWLGWFNDLYLTYRAWQRWILAERVFREVEREKRLDRIMFTSVARLEESFDVREDEAEEYLFVNVSID